MIDQTREAHGQLLEQATPELVQALIMMAECRWSASESTVIICSTREVAGVALARACGATEGELPAEAFVHACSIEEAVLHVEAIGGGPDASRAIGNIMQPGERGELRCLTFFEGTWHTWVKASPRPEGACDA